VTVASTLTLAPAVDGPYELREEGALRGTLARYGTQPQIVIATATWDLTQHRAGLGVVGGPRTT
jgi:hypothetical protein